MRNEEQITRDVNGGAEAYILNRITTKLRDSIQRTDELCSHCCALIANGIGIQSNPSSLGGIFPHYKEDRNVLLESTCRLCRFMGSLKAHDGGRRARITIRSIHDLNPHFADYDLSTSMALVTFITSYDALDDDWGGSYVGEGRFGLLHSDFPCDNIRPRLIEPSSIDFSIVLGWLHFCGHYHGDTCSSLVREEVHGMKVINCQTRRVIQAEKSFRYVALSYVWGTAVTQEMEDGFFPSTIEDSILVTLKLGYHYLWVDKYVQNHIHLRVALAS
jgi:hypothetical protein